mmetsp:Transcript_4059/g.11022  ORF Transcript_4059/g.11022 Transcript_4059/m.11022 type:complete len:396 (-) Transcript_4059:151-1338(-)
MQTMTNAWLSDTLFGDAENVSHKGSPTNLQALAALTSVGSSAHADGTCRPCAHSWKPGGCSKGHGCPFCHLCTESDFRRRRKERETKCKVQKKEGKLDGEAELRHADSSSDLQSLKAQVPDAAVAPPAQKEVELGPAMQQACACDSLRHRSHCIMQMEEVQAAKRQQQLGGAQADEPGLASMGSLGHAEGTCRPCAHSWKPGGCVKGFSCTFCHLCSEDDFRRTRKDRASYFRAQKALVGNERGLAEDCRETGSEGSSTYNEVPTPSRDVDAGRYHLTRIAAALPVVSSIGKPRNGAIPPLGLPPGLFDVEAIWAMPMKGRNNPFLADSLVGCNTIKEPAYISVQEKGIDTRSSVLVDSWSLGYLGDVRQEDCRSKTNIVMNPGEPARISLVFAL